MHPEWPRWTAADRERDDQLGADRRLERVNAAITAREKALAEAARKNRDGWPLYSGPEREDRETRADVEFQAVAQSEEEEVLEVIAKFEVQLADHRSQQRHRLVGQDISVLQREQALREVIRLEIAHSTPDEIEQQAGAAVRGADRVLAMCWAREIGAHLQSADGINPTTRQRLLEIKRATEEASLDPEAVKVIQGLERRIERLRKHQRELAAALHPTRVAANRTALQRSGGYGRL